MTKMFTEKRHLGISIKITKLILLWIFVQANVTVDAQNTQLTGGNNFSVGLCGSGTVFAWGSNTSGQIGQGTLTTTEYTSPTAVLGFTSGLKFSQVCAGSGAHALALDCNKNVWSWGENQCGQTGNGGSTSNCGSATSVPQSTPLKVLTGAQGDPSGFLSKIVAIGGGNNFSMAIEAGTGKVYAWGQNAMGELGNNSTTSSSTPVLVQTCSSGPLTNIVMIQGGDQSAYALDAYGKVWAWGDNSNRNLGNGTANSSCAVPVKISGGSQLSGIKMIAAGDTHGMALDSTGQVWTWGGDWGPGQLGQGATYVSTTYASRVVEVNNFSAKGSSGPYITNAVYIAAGQASSAIVLSDGSVVSFGAYGLYPGSACGTNTLLFSGTLGNGYQAPNNGTCYSNSSRGTSFPPGATTPGYGTPEYVMINDSTKLGSTSPIVSIARGDAWYFAIDATGTTYTWGYNGANGTISSLKGGMLGIGNTTDQPYAIPVTLPAACGSISVPCPSTPSLGVKLSVCPGSPFTINSNTTGTGYTYDWLSSTTGTTGSFSTIAGETSSTYSSTLVGNNTTYYAVEVNASNACGSCPTVSDTIKVAPLTASYTGKGTYCSTSSDVQFTATDSTGKAKFQWFLNQSPGSSVPSGITSSSITSTTNSIILPKVNSNTSFGSSCPYSLFVQDTATYSGTLQPSQPCSSTSSVNATGLNGPLTLIKVNRQITIDSMQFVASMGTNSKGTYSFSIYNEVAKGTTGSTTMNCNSPCTPNSASVAALSTPLYTSPGVVVTTTTTSGDFVETLTGSYTLTPGNYWIGLNVKSGGGTAHYLLFTCTEAYSSGFWSSSVPDNTNNDIVEMISAAYTNSVKDAGALYNIQFRYSSPYSCERLQVCASSGGCPLPVTISSFVANKGDSYNLLEWSTTNEINTSYFEIQRSTDGINFVTIGKTFASGNLTNTTNYSYKDYDLHTSSVIYYRLKEVDNDGKYTFSNIEKVKTGGSMEIKVVPNPNEGKFKVNIEGYSSEIHIILFNVLGEELLEINNYNDNNWIDIQQLPSGVYLLNIQTNNGSYKTKVIKR